MGIKRPKSSYPIPEHAERVFRGIIYDVYQWEQENYDGTTTTFEKLRRVDTAIIIPVTTEGAILITEQEQPGRKPFLTTAGGRINPGEDPLQAGKRELLEETGYEAEELVLWSATQPVSKIDWAIYIFIGHKCTKVAEQNPDSGEKIRLTFVTFEEFIDLVVDGTLDASETLLKIAPALANLKRMKELKTLFRI